MGERVGHRRAEPGQVPRPSHHLGRARAPPPLSARPPQGWADPGELASSGILCQPLRGGRCSRSSVSSALALGKVSSHCAG